MRELFGKLLEKVQRDRAQGLGTLAKKSLRYAQELATAPLYLAQATHVGQGARTLGRPRIDNEGRLVIGRGTLLRSINVPVELGVGQGATLEIGDESVLNYGVSIGCMRSVRIGHRVRIGPYVMIIDTEFHSLYDRKQMPEPRPVVIEDDVWLGAKSSVLPGVTIGRGSVVGVSSVVSADVPPFTMVAGIPARPVKKLDPNQFVVR
jgi:maltose O-acetyltransferase